MCLSRDNRTSDLSCKSQCHCKKQRFLQIMMLFIELISLLGTQSLVIVHMVIEFKWLLTPKDSWYFCYMYFVHILVTHQSPLQLLSCVKSQADFLSNYLWDNMVICMMKWSYSDNRVKNIYQTIHNSSIKILLCMSSQLLIHFGKCGH